MATPNPNVREVLDGGDDAAVVSLADLIDNLIYYWPWFVKVALAVMVLGLAWTFLQTPIYQADALIQVEPQKGSTLGALKDVSSLLDMNTSPVPGEIEVLKSRTVRLDAMQRSGADVDVKVKGRIPIIGGWLSRVLTPGDDGLVPAYLPFSLAYGGESLQVAQIVVPAAYLGQALTVESLGAGRYRLYAPDGRVLGEGQVGVPAAFASGRTQLTLSELRARPGNRFTVLRYEPRARIKGLGEALTITEAGRNSSIIKVAFEDRDPNRARDFLNALVDAYVARNVSHRSEEAAKSLAFLRTRLPELRRQLTAAESQLNAFRDREQILDVTEQTKALLERAVSLETARQTLELQRAELSLRYEPAHPTLQAVDAQLHALRTNLARSAADIRRLPQKEQQYVSLERDVRVDNELYVGLLNNAEQLEVARAGTVGNVSVIDRAVQPEKPARPKKALLAALFGLLGVGLGFAATQLIAFLTSVVRDPRKLEQATGLSAMALVPYSPEQSGSDYAQTRAAYLVSSASPNSAVVEALRSLRTAVLFSLSTQAHGKVLLVTSATSSQGKSFIAANLAVLFAANSGRRVLIIDADIRKRSLREYLPIAAGSAGLTDLLTGRRALDPSVLVDLGEGLYVLPPGEGVQDPGRVLTGEGFGQVIDWAVAQFDLVVIDSAPVLAVNDTLELAKHADETLFVVRQGEVSLAEVNEALTSLRRVGVTVAGFAFNAHQPTGIRYGYGYGYGYKYGYRKNYAYRYGADS